MQVPCGEGDGGKGRAGLPLKETRGNARPALSRAPVPAPPSALPCPQCPPRTARTAPRRPPRAPESNAVRDTTNNRTVTQGSRSRRGAALCPLPCPCSLSPGGGWRARASCVSSPARGHGSGVCAPGGPGPRQPCPAAPSAPSSLPSRGGEGAENVPPSPSPAPSGDQSIASGPPGLPSLGLGGVCDVLGENHRERWGGGGGVSHWGLNAGVAGRRAGRTTRSPSHGPRVCLVILVSPKRIYRASAASRAEGCRSPGTQNEIKPAHSTVSAHGLRRAPARSS